MSKKIMTIAGISFALIFVIVMALIFSNVISFGNSANKDLQKFKEDIINAELEAYDDKIVSGDTVIATVNKLKETKNGIKLSYLVSPTGSSVYQQYGFKALSWSSGSVTIVSPSSIYEKYDTSLNTGDSSFISPVKEFESKIITNGNGVIVGIVFKAL